MRFKLTPRSMLFAVLCVCLMSEELRLRNALAVNTGRIVFTSMRDGNAEIYVMDADGGNQENLTNHPAHDGDPDWSPDGTKIAFESWRDGNGEIYVMDADGKNPIRLTDGPGGKRHPDWSPDGGKIAFSVDDLEDYIAVMDADGRNREILDDRAMYPSWSPDGKQIAFVHGEIYVIGVGGQGRKKVTDDSVGKWSPIVFSRWTADSIRRGAGRRIISHLCGGGGWQKSGEAYAKMKRISGDPHGLPMGG